MGKESNKIGPGRTTNPLTQKNQKSLGGGHGPMFGKPSEALHWGRFPDGGGYPLGFVEWAFEEMSQVSGKAVDPEKVLHLCSGSMKTGIRVDIRPEMNPTYICDCRNVPLPDSSLEYIMADPPYSKQYAENLYGTQDVYPKPSEILKEATRLLQVGGLVGILHHQVPVFKKPLKLHKVYAVHRGLGFSIVAWSLFIKT